MSVQELTRAAIVDMLMNEGHDDVLVLDAADQQELLTTERQRLFDRICENGGESVRELSEALDREPAAVSRDLKKLFEYDMIQYYREGKRKIPGPSHKTVIFLSISSSSKEKEEFGR